MDSPDAGYRRFFCVSCGVQLKAKASTAGRQLPCPKCGTVLVVPLTVVPPTVVSPTVVPPTVVPPYEHSGPVQPVAGDTYEIREMPEATGHAGVDHACEGNADGGNGAGGYGGGRLERVPSARPKPPRWPLARGVFSFLLEPGAIICWSMLSFMGTLFFSMLLASFALGQIRLPVTWMGSMIFLAVSFALGLLFAIINAIYCLTILQESAAGNRVMEDWPGLVILDHLAEAFIFINSMLISAVVAWLIASPLAGFELLRAFCEAGCFVVLFPVVLLSMLEAGSCLMPISPAVFQAMRRSRRTWLVFYIESFVFAFGLLGYLVLLGFLLPLLADYCKVEITIPLILLAVALGVGPAILLEMIYFRLIGRLAWVCDEDSRRELAEEKAAEEEAEKQREATEIRPPPVDDF